jgi:integrating conjugative element protein (TIGR03755 family)
MQKTLFVLLLVTSLTAHASDIIPMGHGNNKLYYKIGGGSDFTLPPVSSTRTTLLDAKTNLGIGYSCGAFNPALSITNSINDLKDSVDNLEQNIISSATGSLIQLPMYLLAQANPTAYNLLNNTLLNAHKKLELSTKSCETIKNQIAKGQNPYQDWGTLSVNDQWKKHLTFVSSGNEDINNSKKDIDAHSGETGVPWVQGKSDSDSSLHAGGKSQPPIQVISDTVKSGYNALLNRDLQSDLDAPDDAQNSELKHFFPNPKSASLWITNVIGDQVITTCNDDSCKKQQGSLVGHGLLPWVTSCQADKDNCADTIRDDLGNLVTGNQAITKDNLSKVSADGIAVSPDVISSIRGMDVTQQKIIINKLSQEVAVQRVMDKAFIAKNILSTGAQVPVIAANHPAQVIIGRAITNLDNDIRSLSFESQMRRQTISDTISETLKFENQQQQDAMRIAPASSSSPLMENGAITKESPK